MSHIASARLQGRPASAAIGRRAVVALYDELVLFPKPGLVSRIDCGAHRDMDAACFFRSLFALRRYFVDSAAAGALGSSFAGLQDLGREAERRMLVATGGVNTHRGAIFCLGLLAAAAGWRHARGLALTGDGLAETVLARWGDAIQAAGRQAGDSHGSRAVRRYGARGARGEVLAGFPTLLGAAMPALQDQRHPTPDAARIQALFATMAALDDTNLLHRGGPEGLAFVQDRARQFLAAGGVAQPAWRDQAVALHRDCVARHLSPGGSADILAAALFLHALSA